MALSVTPPAGTKTTPTTPAPTTPAPTTPADEASQLFDSPAISDGEEVAVAALDNGFHAAQSVAGWGLPFVAGSAPAVAFLQQQRDGQVMNYKRAAAQQGLRMGPALVSALIGPAVADGVTFVAPGLLPKYRVDMKSAEKTTLKWERFGAAAGAVGLGAALVFLKFPDMLMPKAANMRMADDAVRQLRTSGVYSNRVVAGVLGGAAVLALGSRALDNKGTDTNGLAIATAATGVATLGAMVAMPLITKGSGRATSKAFLAEDGIMKFWKPNLTWVKDFGMKVAPFTAVPAGYAAFDFPSSFDAAGALADNKYKPVTAPVGNTTPTRPGSGSGTVPPRPGGSSGPRTTTP